MMKEKDLKKLVKAGFTLVKFSFAHHPEGIRFVIQRMNKNRPFWVTLPGYHPDTNTVQKKMEELENDPHTVNIS